MSSTATISDYVAGLHRRLPAAIADEAADGLLETYEHHIATGAGERAATHAAIADFGDLRLVVREYTRQAPGRRIARVLLATGPVAGACWAAALIQARAWTWPLPNTARLGFGAALLLTVTALAVAATSRRSYRRTRITAAAGPVILLLDATAVATALLATPALTLPFEIAATASLTRIALTAWMLPRTSTH